MHVRDPLDLLPLRQMVAASGDAAPVLARQDLLDRLSRPHRYRIVGRGNCGQILAASELALAEARVLLRQAYGDLLTFGATSVHSYVDPQTKTPMVPVLFVRIDAPRAHRRDLLDILKGRRADLKDVERQRDRVVLRAELEFSRALGLQREVLELADGSAHFLSWLLEYRRAGSGTDLASDRSHAGNNKRVNA